MTAMNWTKTQALRHGYQNAYDELPRAGSLSDQVRYLKLHPAKKSTKSKVDPDNHYRFNVFKAIEGVRKAVAGISSPSFMRKSQGERDRFIECLKKVLLEGKQHHEFQKSKIVKTAMQLCGMPTSWVIKSVNQ